nr:heme-binding protein [Aeromicrobium wangtongii]
MDRDAATAVADTALAEAASRGLRVSVAVVDERGHDLVVVRGDGAAWFTPGVARAKAATAAAMGRPTSDLADLREAHPELLDLLAGQVAHPLTTLPGGLPLMADGRCVGAVGVSGAHPDDDVACAATAAAAAS